MTARGSLQGVLVRDIARAPLGRVSDVLLDPDTLAARWLGVTLEDGTTALVPAASASESEPGELLVPYPAELIATARHGGGTLTESDARRLLTLYGFEG